MQIQPYLFFDGRCEEAIEFYKKAVGARVQMLMRYKDAPDPKAAGSGPPQAVMHSAVQIGDSTIFASDGQCAGNPKFGGFSLSITAKDAADAQRLFDGLKEDGQVVMPLSKTFFSPSFGMLSDRFGIGWMVMVQPSA
jgi:PhnB protein